MLSFDWCCFWCVWKKNTYDSLYGKGMSHGDIVLMQKKKKYKYYIYQKVIRIWDNIIMTLLQNYSRDKFSLYSLNFKLNLV